MIKNKKGFTVVELVIVIAILAILAAVLIPTFASLIAKANESNTLKLVKNLNTALRADKPDVTTDKHETMYDALQAAKGFGYDVEKINANKSATGDNEILWDSVNDCFVYVKGNEKVYAPDTLKVNKTVESYRYWTISDTESDTYSTYFYGFTGTEVTAKTGVDVGEITGITKINYVGNTTAQTVAIRTNGSTQISVNAAGDTVNFYGEAGNIDVVACAGESFHIFGKVNGTVTVNKGHISVEDGAVLAQPIIVKDTTGNVEISAKVTVSVVVEDTANSNVKIESDKTIYVDDKSGKATKPSTAIVPTEIGSEADFTKGKFEVLKDEGMTDAGANVLNGYYKLTADITVEHLLYIQEGSTVVIDLNGHNIHSTFAGFVFGNWGTLTVNGDGCIYNDSDSSANGQFGHDGVRNFGMLTINGGTWGDNNTDKTDANNTTFGAAVRNQAGATCVINGGSFTCVDEGVKWDNGKDAYSYAIRNFGTMIINDAYVYGAMHGGVAADAGHIEINGGTYSVTGKNSYHVLTTSAAGGGTMTINGGRFEKTGNDRYVFSGFNGMPSWDATESLASNGYTVNGGTFIRNGEEVTLK